MSEQQIKTTFQVARFLTISFVVFVFFYPILTFSFIGNAPYNVEFSLMAKIALGAGILLLMGAKRFSQMPFEILKKKPNLRQSPRHIVSTYLLSVIIGLLFREGAALAGVVASVLSKNLLWCSLLGVAAFIEMMRHWPRKEEVREVLLKHLE